MRSTSSLIAHGLAGTAAQFAWHVSDLMNKDRAYVAGAFHALRGCLMHAQS